MLNLDYELDWVEESLENIKAYSCVTVGCLQKGIDNRESNSLNHCGFL